jgi:imidazolonepropionase-like amidohydrolase
MKATLNIFLGLFCLCFSSLLYAQQTPAPPQNQMITITGATAHIGNGTVIPNAWLTFEQGKITYVGPAKDEAIRGREISAQGQHLYPGFIAPNTTLGLVEIDAVKASDDKSEIGKMLPHVRSLIAYNAESQVVETCRPNGVLTAQICPRGGRISGRSSIVQLDAWNWQDAVIRADDGIHLNWPGSFSRKRWWAGEGRGYKVNEDYAKEITALSNFFDAARAYSQNEGQNQEDLNLLYAAMEGVIQDEAGLFVHVQGEKEILDLIAFKKQQNLARVIIVGGHEAHQVADEIKKANISVLLRRVHSTPQKEDEDYDLPFKNPRLLVEAGVLTALEGSGRMERMNTRNLPFYAGTAAAYGLDPEVALQLITLNTARILGIDEQLGSLEIGKDATIFLSRGDALDMKGNQLTNAFIQGRQISLETHQTELYQRYKNKYDRQ